MKKVIIFGNTRWLGDIVTVLESRVNILEVVEVMSIGMSFALLEEAHNHPDADALVILGRAIKSKLPLVLRKLRTITRAPILVLMNEELSTRKKNNLTVAGATAVLAREVIISRELVEAFVEMMPKRPELRLVKSETQLVNEGVP